MKRTKMIMSSVVCSLIAVVWLCNWAAPSLKASPPTTHFIEQQIIVTAPPDTHVILSGLGFLEELDSITPIWNDTIRIKLYTIINGDSVATAINTIHTAAPKAKAEPNWVMAAATNTYVWGSPWATPTLNISPTLYQEQWALSAIQLIDEGSGNRTIPETGDGSLIYMIDTSPFNYPVTTSHAYTTPMPDGTHLHVWHTEPISSPMQGIATHGGHGTIVADLAHLVAPEAELHLFRALDEYGFGNLFTLNKVLNHLLYHAQSREERAVINLSLGILSSANITQSYSLEYLLSGAYQIGHIIIAAAGNFSYINENGHSVTAPTQHPARLPYVLAVAATDYTSGKSCFSSESVDIAAPGGNGDSWCQPPVNTCGPEGQYCVIGWNPASETTFAGVQGSSFATSLVSGQAALMWQRGETSANVNQIMCALRGSALYRPEQPALGYGLTNIPASLDTLISLIDGKKEQRFVCPSISLAIHKKAPPMIMAYNLFTYTLTVTNTGLITAMNVIIQDTLPTSVTHISGGNLIGNIVHWPASDLPPGGTIQAHILVTANANIIDKNYQAWAYGGMVKGQEPITTTVLLPLRLNAHPTTHDIVLQATHIEPHTTYEIWQSHRPYPGSDTLLTELTPFLPQGDPIAYTHLGAAESLPQYYTMHAYLDNHQVAHSNRIGIFPVALTPGQ